MNKDNQDSTYGYPPDFISPEALSSLIQKRNRRPIIGKSESNLREPFQKLSIPRKAPVSFPELSESTSSFGESQSASLVPKTRALSSQLQQTGNNPTELPLPTRFQTGQQTSSVEKFLGSVLQHPRTISNFSKNQSASTLCAQNFHSQQMRSNPVDALPLQTQFQHHQQTSSVEKFLGSVSQQQQTISNFSKNQSASALWAPSSHSQQTGSNPIDELPLHTRFQHDQQTSYVEKFLGSVSQHQGTTESAINYQSTSISKESEDLKRFPTICSLLISPSKRQAGESASSSKKQKTRPFSWSSESQFTSRKHETAICTKQKTRNFSYNDVPLLVSPSKHETLELTSPSKKQTTRPFSWSSESQFASRKHETAICTKQQTINFSYPDQTFDSRKKVTSVSLNTNEEKQSTPVKTMSASIKQVTSERPKQQTGLCPILGEPESSIKNSFTKDYKALHDNGKMAERLYLFDKFRCVKCGVKFADQDKLLSHEQTHFND